MGLKAHSSCIIQEIRCEIMAAYLWNKFRSNHVFAVIYFAYYPIILYDILVVSFKSVKAMLKPEFNCVDATVLTSSHNKQICRGHMEQLQKW